MFSGVCLCFGDKNCSNQSVKLRVVSGIKFYLIGTLSGQK